MTEPLSLSEHVAELARRLNPPLFRKEIAKNVRGGLPSSSIPEGSPSASKPSPHLDPTDVEMLRLLAAYNRRLFLAEQAMIRGAVQKAADHLEHARVLETAVLIERHMTAKEWKEYEKNLRRAADEENAPKGRDCENDACKRRVLGGRDDPMFGGRCRRCHRYWKKHEKERPLELCVMDIDRALTKAAANT